MHTGKLAFFWFLLLLRSLYLYLRYDYIHLGKNQNRKFYSDALLTDENVLHYVFSLPKDRKAKQLSHKHLLLVFWLSVFERRRKKKRVPIQSPFVASFKLSLRSFPSFSSSSGSMPAPRMLCTFSACD